MNEWSDNEEINEVDFFVLPSEKVPALTDKEDTDENQVGKQGLPNDVCKNTQIKTTEFMLI